MRREQIEKLQPSQRVVMILMFCQKDLTEALALAELKNIAVYGEIMEKFKSAREGLLRVQHRFSKGSDVEIVSAMNILSTMLDGMIAPYNIEMIRNCKGVLDSITEAFVGAQKQIEASENKCRNASASN